MSDEEQGVALPWKCPELPACGLSPNAAPAVIPENANAPASAMAATLRRILCMTHLLYVPGEIGSTQPPPGEAAALSQTLPDGTRSRKGAYLTGEG